MTADAPLTSPLLSKSEARVFAEAARRELAARAEKEKAGKGCLMAVVPDSEADKIVEWAKRNIPKDTLAGDGLESEPHVTVLYGFDIGFDAGYLARYFAGAEPVECVLGPVGRFECDDYDVLYLDVEPGELARINSGLSREFKDQIVPSEHAYKPHLTLAYVRKGSNSKLDGDKSFAGRAATCGKLLYSEPDGANRSSIYLSNTRPVLASDTGGTSASREDKRHSLARDAAAAVYSAAVARWVAAAEHEAAKERRSKASRDDLLTLWLLTVGEAGESSYKAAAGALGLDHAEGEAEEFAAGRAEYLGKFPERAADRLDAAADGARAEGLGQKEVLRRVRREGAEVERGEGRVLAEAEAQATYGVAALRLLDQAGFATVQWVQVDRPTKRESHHLNEQLGEVPLGYMFPNGQRHPGDPAAGPGECVNCLCQLVGVRRKPAPKKEAG